MDEILNLGHGAMVIGGLDASYDFATLAAFLTRLEETDADPDQEIMLDLVPEREGEGNHELT